MHGTFFTFAYLFTHTLTLTHCLCSMVEAELAREKARRQRAQKNRGTRHSSFGGTFVVKNQKSISGKERVYHRPLAGMYIAIGDPPGQGEGT